MDLGAVIESILRHEELSSTVADEVMAALMEGEVSDVQTAGFLTALRAKGTTGRELAAFAHAMRSRAVSIPSPPENLIDTCGTGGGIPSFNISTGAAIVAAAAGVKVAKHGNRAMTSKCGSADVLEALGVKLIDDPVRLSEILNEVGIAFLFAPSHYPAMRHVAPVRRALGVRTVFNQLGPLLNPAGAVGQIIGVYDPALGPAMAEAAQLLGVKRVWIVHGTDGMDELSPCASSEVWSQDGYRTLSSEDFGLSRVSHDALTPGSDATSSAEILKEAISDIDSPRAPAILPSAAAAIHLAGLAESLHEAGEMARAAIAHGGAKDKLEQLIQATNV